MVIFNIIYPAKYLSTDSATSKPKSPSENQVGVNGRWNARSNNEKRQEIIEDL